MPLTVRPALATTIMNVLPVLILTELQFLEFVPAQEALIKNLMLEHVLIPARLFPLNIMETTIQELV